MEDPQQPQTAELSISVNVVEDGGYKIKKKTATSSVVPEAPRPIQVADKPEPAPQVAEEDEKPATLGKRMPSSTSPGPKIQHHGQPGETMASPKIEDRPEFYEFSKLLGSGTFGVVGKYRDLRTKRYVAIKKLVCDGTDSWQNREVSMLEKLIHPNIVRIKSAFRTQEPADKPNAPPKRLLNIVMDYIPDNLHKIIEIVQHFVKQKATFPDTLVMIYSYQLFRCLHFLKVHSVAHRDIKPQNILVDTSTHRLFFCDFGSAKTLKQDEPSEDYICSRFYRAPELLYGNKHYNCAIDTWSVGCVMAEMVLGIPLFIGENTQDQIAKIADLLGQPDDAEMKAMGSKIPATPRKAQANTLRQRLQTKINKDGLDLLSRVFAYDPEKRIKPIEALQHPYFDPLRVQRMSINQKPITDLFDFNQEESKGYERYIRKLTPEWYKRPTS